MARSTKFLLLTTLLQVFSFALSTLADSTASKAYTPSKSSCAGPQVRSAGSGEQSINPQEASYVSNRKADTLPQAWAAYYAAINAYADQNGLTIPDYLGQIFGGSSVPDGLQVGIALSGGGYRAAAFGAGILNAFDGRNATAQGAGTGGLLQGASYISGLSGGSWLLTSLAQANFPTLPSLLFGTDSDNSAGASNTFGGWLAQYGLIDPSSNIITEAEYLANVVSEVQGKFDAGFPVSITDVWARTLSRHFVNGTTSANFFNDDVPHGAGLLWSDLKRVPSFTSYQQPFPIIVANSKSSHENDAQVADPSEPVPLSNVIYEFTPYEFGSYDPMLSAFIPTSGLGSSGSQCVTGFDQTAYIAAASSSLFNSYLSSILPSSLSSIISELLPGIVKDVVYAEVPNPFVGVQPGTFIDSSAATLSLVDGGEDGETIPFQPLLTKTRGLDVIVAVDAAADTSDNYSNGTSVIDTQKRVALYPSSYSFPPIPATADDFVSQGLTKRPTFFGCDTTNDAPLVIYLANGGPPLGEPGVTNTDTTQFTYQPSQLQSILDQTFDIATQGIPNGNQKDPQWPLCLACAVADRARARSNTPRSGICQSCLARYCWS